MPVLDNGGVAVVIGGRSTNFPDELRNNPRFLFWDSTDPDTNKRELPTNTRAVLLTRFISHATFEKAVSTARKRKLIVYPALQGTGEIKRILESLEKEEKPVEAQARGSVKQFVKENADFHRPAADEARRLYEKAVAEGFPTTEGSLAVCIAKIKREKGYGEIPKSVQPPKSPQENALRTLDDAIAGLQLVREFVANTEKQNQTLMDRIARMKAALE